MSDNYFKKMPLIWHIKELRKRLLLCIFIYSLAVIFCYHYAYEIYQILSKPLLAATKDDGSRKLIFTGLTEAFFTYIKLAFFGGFILSFPFLALQAYLFVEPGLYKKEKYNLLPFLFAAPILFMFGAALAYFYVIPLAWEFFLSFEQTASSADIALVLQARISEYLSLVISLIVGFGMAFQLPIVLVLMVQFGFIRTSTLITKRRHAIVLIFIAAAILTPPDVLSQIALAIPMMLLYELSIVICSLVEKKSTINDRYKIDSGNPSDSGPVTREERS